MTDEVAVEQGQESTAQETEETSEAFAEGFGEVEEPQEIDSEPAEEAEAEPAPAQEAESPDTVNKEVKELKKQVFSLQKALHTARQEKAKPREEPEEALTEDQLVAIMEKHKDDPRTQLKVMQYAAQQAAKGETANLADTQRASQLKKQTEERINSAFPDLQDETTPLSQGVTNHMQALDLNDHPAGKYLATCALVAENMENIKKSEYERGRQEGLKGAAENKRKQSVKENTLGPGGTPTKPKKGELSPEYAAYADQLGLTGNARKRYAQFVS